jgi:hypothetical protein
MEKIDIAKAMAAQWAGAAAAGGGGPAAGDPAWSIDGWHSEQVVVMLDELLMTAKTLPAAQLAQMEELCDESTFAGWLRWRSTAHGLLRVADLVRLMPWLWWVVVRGCGWRTQVHALGSAQHRDTDAVCLRPDRPPPRRASRPAGCAPRGAAAYLWLLDRGAQAHASQANQLPCTGGRCWAWRRRGRPSTHRSSSSSRAKGA